MDFFVVEQFLRVQDCIHILAIFLRSVQFHYEQSQCQPWETVAGGKGATFVAPYYM